MTMSNDAPEFSDDEIAQYVQAAIPSISAFLEAIDEWSDRDEEYPLGPIHLEGAVARITVQLMGNVVLFWRGSVGLLKQVCESGIHNLNSLLDEKGDLTSRDIAGIV